MEPEETEEKQRKSKIPIKAKPLSNMEFSERKGNLHLEKVKKFSKSI